MSQRCSILKCGRTSRAPCDCCKQHLCLQHLNEHNTLLISQLNPLTDEINTLNERLRAYMNHETILDCRRKLEQCRKECHEKINHFFKIKNQELDQLIATRVDKQQEKIHQLQSSISRFTREQETTRHDVDSCIAMIRQLHLQMNKIEETCFRINTHSLEIDNSLVQIQETHVHEFNLSTLLHVYQALDRPSASYLSLASNDQFLLIHQNPNLCLVDSKMNIIKQVLWTYDTIWDMCWSSSLKRFIIIEENNICLVDERTMSIVNVRTNGTRKWVSCTCFDVFLFLSTRAQGSSIVKLNLPPSMSVVKEWKSSNRHAKYERIDDIVSNNETLVLLIRNNLEKSLRMELRSCKTLDHIWSLSLDIVCNQDRRFNCCALHSNEWLVADYETERLLHITKDGVIKEIAPYKAIPYCVTLFNANILAVSRAGGINFYKI